MNECKNCGNATNLTVECHQCGHCLCGDCFDRILNETVCEACKSAYPSFDSTCHHDVHAHKSNHQLV